MKKHGALSVSLSLRELTRLLNLPNGQEVTYAGDFDIYTGSVKLTIQGDGLPVPKEGCRPDDGYLDILVDKSGKLKESHVITFNPKSVDIGG